MKQYREVIQFGDFYRLRSPYDGNFTAWMAVSPDKKTALVGWYRLLSETNGPCRRVKLQGLDPGQSYTVDGGEAHYANGITVADVAGYVALNRSYLFTLFRRVLGVSPQECLTQFRLTWAREQLTLTDASVANIALSCGYQDPQVFSKAFKRLFGVTPVKYRKRDREQARRSLEHLAERAEKAAP